MFDRRAICLLIMKLFWKHISFAFFPPAAGHMAHISFLDTAGWGQTLSLFHNMLTESFWAWLDVSQNGRLSDIWGSLFERSVWQECQYCITGFQQFLSQHYWTAIVRSTSMCSCRRFTVWRISVLISTILHFM